MVAQAKAGEEAIKDLQDISEGFAMRFMSGFMPEATKALVDFNNTVSGTSTDVWRSFGDLVGNVVRGIVNVFLVAAQTIHVVWTSMTTSLMDGTKGLIDVAGKLVQGDLKGAWTTAKAYSADSTAKQRRIWGAYADMVKQEYTGKPPEVAATKRPPGTGGGGNGDEEKALKEHQKLVDARAAYEEAVANGELLKQKARDAQREAEDKEAYDKGLQTLNEYYDARRQRINAEADAERAQAMLERLGASGAQALEKLAWREPAEIAGLLEAQAPQLIAAVAAQLPRDVAAAVLELLPGKTRADTLLALAHSDAPSADMLGDLDDWLASLDAAAPPQGEAAVAGLLGQMSEGSAAAALSQLDRNDAELAARLRVRNLAFEDLARLPEASRKTFLRNVAARTLLHALKGSDGQVLDALTAVMSPTAAQRMRVDLDTLGPVPVTTIQAAQDEAGASLRRLAAEGAIQFPEEEAA